MENKAKKNDKFDPADLKPEDMMKFEIATELGLADKVINGGWRSLTAKESGLLCRYAFPSGICRIMSPTSHFRILQNISMVWGLTLSFRFRRVIWAGLMCQRLIRAY